MSLLVKTGLDSLHKLCLLVLVVFYHFAVVIGMSQLQMATQVIAYKIRITVRVGDTYWAYCWLTTMVLIHVLKQALSRKVRLRTERAFVGAAIDCRFLLLLGYYLSLDDGLSKLNADLAIFGVVFCFHQIHKVVARGLDHLGLHLLLQLLVRLLLSCTDRLAAFWTIDTAFASLHTIEAAVTENCLTDFVHEWNFRNAQANHALVVFFLNNWAGIYHQSGEFVYFCQL